MALVGGLAPALIAAVAGSMLLNYFFTPPLHTLTIADTNNALALLVFVLVAMLVSSVVDLAARRTRQAARAAAESRTLANLAGSVLAAPDALAEMLERVRETFGLTSVTLLEKDEDGWVALASAGPAVAPARARRTTEVPAGDRARARPARPSCSRPRTSGWSAPSPPRSRSSWTGSGSAEAAAEAAPLAEANKMRTALLAAVGHDLRTPLAAAKAAVSSLRSADVDLAAEDRRELLAGSRRVARPAGGPGRQPARHEPAAGRRDVDRRCSRPRVDEVVARALDDLGAGRVGGRWSTCADDLPLVLADPGLLERVLANLVANALRYAPPSAPPLLTGSRLGDRVEIRVVDRGPGIPADAAGTGLPALPAARATPTTPPASVSAWPSSRGLTEAMGGTLEPEETPGGGLTMVVSLPAAADLGRADPRAAASESEVGP